MPIPVAALRVALEAVRALALRVAPLFRTADDADDADLRGLKK